MYFDLFHLVLEIDVMLLDWKLGADCMHFIQVWNNHSWSLLVEVNGQIANSVTVEGKKGTKSRVDWRYVTVRSPNQPTRSMSM